MVAPPSSGITLACDFHPQATTCSKMAPGAPAIEMTVTQRKGERKAQRSTPCNGVSFIQAAYSDSAHTCVYLSLAGTYPSKAGLGTGF